jgi:hypothetical protein
MLKKLLSAALCITVVVGSAGSSLAASTTQEQEAVLMRTPEERRNSTHQEKVKDLLTMGAAQEEANFYATLDDKISELERNNQVIDLSGVEAIPPVEIASNPVKYYFNATVSGSVGGSANFASYVGFTAR